MQRVIVRYGPSELNAHRVEVTGANSRVAPPWADRKSQNKSTKHGKQTDQLGVESHGTCCDGTRGLACLSHRHLHQHTSLTLKLISHLYSSLFVPVDSTPTLHTLLPTIIMAPKTLFVAVGALVAAAAVNAQAAPNWAYVSGSPRAGVSEDQETR